MCDKFRYSDDQIEISINLLFSNDLWDDEKQMIKKIVEDIISQNYEKLNDAIKTIYRKREKSFNDIMNKYKPRDNNLLCDEHNSAEFTPQSSSYECDNNTEFTSSSSYEYDEYNNYEDNDESKQNGNVGVIPNILHNSFDEFNTSDDTSYNDSSNFIEKELRKSIKIKDDRIKELCEINKKLLLVNKFLCEN